MPHRAFLVGALGSVLAPSASAFVAGALGVEYLTQEEALAVYFPQADRFEKVVAIPPKDVALRKRKVPAFYFRFEAYAGDKLVGFAIVDDVMGKARPITYLLATNVQGAVLGIEILAYRESHGHEVGREAFRDQFVGRDADDTLRLGGDIRNIAGATISCRSITDGVSDLLALLRATPKVTEVVEDLAPPLSEQLPCDAAGMVCRSRVLMNAPLGIALAFDAAAGDGAAAPDALTRTAALERIERAFAEVARLEALLSAFAPDSDPARLAAAAGQDAVPIAPATRALLERALAVADQTGGAVTPLAAPITALYREAGDAPVHPAALSAAVQLSKRGLVELAGDGARLARAGMGLDFGASGKGFALDRAAEQLGADGLLDFGGQLLVVGAPRAHAVTLEDNTALVLTSGSLATSSASQRGAHVFDARTGQPVAAHGAVTVWAASATEADLWSSALYVLGEKDGLALAQRLGLAAHFGAPPSAAGTPPPAAQASPAWRARFPSE